MTEKSEKASDGQDEKPFEEMLEAEWIEDSSDLKLHQRKEFRLSVRGRDDCWVIISSKRYSLCDLSYSGLGISAESRIAFQIGQFLGDILTDCTLNIGQSCISGLIYRMVHISPDAGDRMICGLSWLNPEPETKKIIESAIQALKAEIFSEDDINEQ